MRTIPTVPDTFEECSTPYSLRQSVAPLGADIAAAPSAQSRRNLGVARCRQIPRDCAQIAHLHPGHPEALQCNGGRRALPGDIQNARDCLVATNSARMAAFGAWLGSTWLARRPHANVERAPKRAWNSRAPNAAILAEFVATQQPRAF